MKEKTRLLDDEMGVPHLLKDGWHGGLGGSIYCHFEKGNRTRSFGNGAVQGLIDKGLVKCDDGWCFSVSLTDKGREAMTTERA